MSDFEALDSAGEGFREKVELLRGVEDGKRNAVGGSDSQSVMQWLRAVMPGSKADSFASENFGQVMRVDAVDCETDAATDIFRVAGAEDLYAGDALQDLARVEEECAFMFFDVHPLQCSQPLDRRRQSSGFRHRLRAGFKAMGDIGVRESIQTHIADHHAAAEERGHFPE